MARERRLGRLVNRDGGVLFALIALVALRVSRRAVS